MLPNQTNESDVFNVNGNSDKINNFGCDNVKHNVDGDLDHNGSNFGYPSNGKITINSVINKGSAMTFSPKVDSLAARRPSALSLKPIVTNVITSDEVDGCFSFGEKELLTLDTQRRINIEFNNLTYSVRCGFCWNRVTKTILNGISGEFRAGELTAIMGPSGAGKSTLMDILTGYTTSLTSGSVSINGQPRNLKRFKNQTAYIMQDHVLHAHITVWEAMNFSVNLKIGDQLEHAEKKLRIRQILEAIGLYENRHTKTGELSGGQRKRLAIALELVDNPPVMFFDEPTSGLDSSTSTQVVSLLKQLAQEGRTIVCTIHQPSALLFGLFDHLYAVAEGQCIFAGGSQMLVPFLAQLDLVCPKTYNPTDYLLEISTHDYGDHNGRLVKKMENGSNIAYRTYAESSAQIYSVEMAEKMMEEGLVTPVKAPSFLPKRQQHRLTQIDDQNESSTKKPKIIAFLMNTKVFCQNNGTYATSFWRQWYLLTLRSILCLQRDRSLAVMRLVIHCCIALLFGTLYYDIGNDASMIFNNFRYIFSAIMFLMFTAFSTMTIRFPLELPIVTREHFNRWYSIKAYYFALTFADLPLQFLCVFIFVAITYFMTSQPFELFRISLFLMVCTLVTLVSQGWGMVIGACFGVTLGMVVGPFLIAPFLVFSGFFLRLPDAHASLHWLFHISYLKHGLEGATLAIFGYDRPKMNCDQLYCQYQIPKKFMKLIDMHHGDFVTVTAVLIFICLLLRTIAFFIMSFRIKRR